MKKVINGKVYDTETATKIGGWDNGYSSNDFNYLSEVLYVTKKGTYFLYGEGGAMSSYRSTYGKNYGYGEHIEHLSQNDALDWASKKLDGDIVQEHFGDVLEDA